MQNGIDRPSVSELPRLSLEERDRRWNAVRMMMEEAGVECLLVVPESAGRSADTYFHNDEAGSTVIFPIDGEPVVIGPPAFRAGAWVQAADRQESEWIRDWRFRPGPATVAEVFKEKGFANSKIGTVGVTAGSHLAPRGTVSFFVWEQLTNSLPNVTWEELYPQFVVIWLTKSSEELALFRYAAQVCEAACEVMMDVTRPGVGEHEIMAALISEIRRLGCWSSAGMNLLSGKDNPSWGFPKWMHRAQQPRRIENGDLVLCEFNLFCGQEEGQANMTIGVGEVDEINIRAAQLARESYEIFFRSMKPGVKFVDIVDQMTEPLRRNGAWYLTPVVHSLNPLYCSGRVTEGIENVPGISERYGEIYEGRATGTEIVSAEGMTWQVQPNACFGRHRVNIGGNAITTEQGAVELNSIPCEMRFV